jgi:3-amino-5-hydroxybenzoate synthase
LRKEQGNHMEALAMNKGTAAKQKSFPEWPIRDQREVAAVTAVINSGQWWRMAGAEVDQFEKEFSAYQGGGYSLAVTNGTQAIEVALSALNIGRGDEVIVPAFSFISTAVPVLSVNATPVFVDVDPVTYCMDPASLATAVTPRTKAIIPVHMAGHAADMDEILDFAARHNLYVIEDAAHGHGAEWRGQRVGAIGYCGIFSFQAGKLMTAGEGGLLLSKDKDFIDRCFLYANCGRPRTDRTYQHAVLATNCRMTELQAAVLRVQLEKLDEQIERREVNAQRLDQLLRDAIPGILPQGQDARVTRNPHYMYMFRYDASEFKGLPRQAFVDALISEGIPAFVAYPPIYKTPAFVNRSFEPRWRADDPLLPDYSGVRLPVSEDIGNNVVWLHHRVLLGDEQDLLGIVETIDKIRRRPSDN